MMHISGMPEGMNKFLFDEIAKWNALTDKAKILRLRPFS